jgi:Rrf2 family protein
MQIPRAFLQRIVAALSRASILTTTPGPKGGLQLARSAAAISLRDVVEALEGPILISECLSGPEVCPLGPSCPVRSRWGGLQAMILGELERTTMAALAADSPPPIDLDLKLDIPVQQTVPIKEGGIH